MAVLCPYSADATLLYGVHGRGNSQHTGLYFLEGTGYVRVFQKGTWSGPFVEGRLGTIMINSGSYGLNQNYQVLGGAALGFKSASEYPWRTLDGVVAVDYSRHLRRITGDVTFGYGRLFIGGNYRRSVIPSAPDIEFSENTLRVGAWLNEHVSVYGVTRSMTFGTYSFVSQTVVPIFPYGGGITILADPVVLQGVIVTQRVRTWLTSHNEVTGWIQLSMVFWLNKEGQ